MFPGGTELLIILLVILLLFGASRIPKMMRGMGEGIRAFKDGLEGKEEPEHKESPEGDPLAEQLKAYIGKTARFEGGELVIGGEGEKKLVEVSNGLVKLQSEESTELVDLSKVKKLSLPKS